MRRQLEEWMHWLPLACAITGIYIVESNLAFVPWKVLGLILAGGSAVYVARVMWHTDKKDSKT